MLQNSGDRRCSEIGEINPLMLTQKSSEQKDQLNSGMSGSDVPPYSKNRLHKQIFEALADKQGEMLDDFMASGIGRAAFMSLASSGQNYGPNFLAPNSQYAAGN